MAFHRSREKLNSYRRESIDMVFSAAQATKRYGGRVGLLLDPGNNGFPRTRTVVMALLNLLIFFIIGGLTIAYPSEVMLVFLIVAVTTIEILIIACATADLRERKLRHYRRNVANTVLTVFFTILTSTTLYGTSWYWDQKSWTLTLASDTPQTVPWPAVVIMQDTAAHYQANMVEQPWTCFIGETQNAPTCSSMDDTEVADLQVSSCNCSESWDQHIQYHFIGNDTKEFVSFVPSPNLVTNSVQAFFNLRVAFNYNSSKWSSQSSIVGSPNLWLLVYDPAIPAQQAYTSGTAGLSLINANGFTTVTLTPTYVQRRDSPPHYEYNAGMSTSPNLNVACDVATHSNSTGNAWAQTAYANCYASVAFRFATMERTNVTEVPVMEWTDVVMNVGSYFALVQFICWVLSGVAWTDMDSVRIAEPG